MTDKKSKYSLSVREKTPSTIEETPKIPQENFIAEFIKRCTEFEIQPLPDFKIENAITDSRIGNRSSRMVALATERRKSPQISGSITRKQDDRSTPIFHLTFENSRKLEGLRKLECKDKSQKLSLCVLNVLYTTAKRYDTLTVLRLSNCNIDAHGIVQISRMLTNLKCIRDLNLDENPNAQENYNLLCTSTGNLLYLSLKRCKISDEGVKKIADELKYDDPPKNPKLLALNLSNNDIGESGATYIGRMLRTNRSVRSLILTGNRIHDDGAASIIQELNMIILTHSEIVDLRRRRYDSLNQLNDKIIDRQEKNDTNTDKEPNSKKISKTSSRQTSRRSKTLSNSDIGLKTIENPLKLPRHSSIMITPDIKIDHPFGKESIPINGTMMSSGNFQLQHLNICCTVLKIALINSDTSISVNRVTGKSLKRLLACVQYQNYMMLGDKTRGLLYISIEGNEFQREDEEDLEQLNATLQSRRMGYYVSMDLGSIITPASKNLRRKISDVQGNVDS